MHLLWIPVLAELQAAVMHCRVPCARVAHQTLLLNHRHVNSYQGPQEVPRWLSRIPCLLDDTDNASGHLHEQLVHGLIPPDGEGEVGQCVLLDVGTIEVGLVQ